ncbi:MAG TPA: PAS domain S-box protein [Williamwhitmania sp.]|nr:PAS domain S-box protein [Williamwhitmania sp.]
MKNLSFLSKLLIGILTIILVAVTVLVYYNYYSFSNHFKKIVANQLESVAILKANDLSVWRNERLSDAKYLKTNQEFHKLVSSYLKFSSDTAVRNQLVSFVKQLQTSHQYDFFLINKTGKVDFAESTNHDKLSSIVSNKAKECIITKKIVFLDFYCNEYTQHAFLGLLIPLNIEGHRQQLDEVAVFRISPLDHLYPTLAKWPTPFLTADIILLRQEGDSMLILNNTKNKIGAALRVRLPITDSIQVKKPSFFTGKGVWIMNGLSGQQYLAYSKKVKGSPWVLVTRIVKQEAYKPLFDRSILLFIIVAIFIVTIVVTLLLVFHFQKSKAYRLTLEREQRLWKKENLYSTLLRNVPQKIFFKNKDLVYESCNEHVAADFGISPEEIVGKTDYDLHSTKLAEKFRADDHRIIASGIAEQMEESYEVDGELRTIIITKTPVKDEQGNATGILGVFTDITKLKENELQVKRVSRIYNVLSEVNQAIVRFKDLKGLYQRICDIGVTIGEYRNIWIGIYDESKEVLEAVAKAGAFEESIKPCFTSLRISTCPVARAFKEKKSQVGGVNIKVDCSFDICNNGVRSFAYFPIILQDKAIGILGVYVGIDNFFSADELKLLEELAADIAFAIDVDAKEQERIKVEGSIKVEKERLEMAQRIGHVGSWELNPVTQIIWATEESFRIYGLELTPNNQVSLEAIESCIPNREVTHQALMNLVERGELFDKEFEVIPSNGEPVRWVHVIAQLEFDALEKSTKVIGAIEDITEQHDYQIALKKSEEYFRLLYEQAPTPYQSLNENGEIVEVNKAWLAHLGFEREEVIGHNFAEFLVPEQVPLFHERYPRFKQAGMISGIDFNLLHKSGKVIVFEVDGRIAYDRDGKFRQTHCVLHDITEKKEAELAIRESEARYKLLFESNPMPMCVYDSVSLNYMAVNEAMVNKYGYSREEFLTMTIKDIRPKVDLDDVQRVVSEQTKLRTYSHPWRHLLKNGNEILVEITSHAIDFLGTQARLVLINDVTEKLEAEKAVRESHQTAQSTLDSLSALICVLDKKGEVVTLNKAWLGHSKANHAILRAAKVGDNFIDNCLHAKTIGKESAYSFADGIKSVISGEARSFSMVYEVEGDRGTLWFLGKVIPFATDNNSLASRVIVISEDITRRKQYEISLRKSEHQLIEQNEAYFALNEELSESNERIKSINEELMAAKEKAEESDRLKSAFLANMSHEIRTPMNGLLGFSEMLGIPNLSSEKRAFYMDIVKKTSQQLLSIINDIIDISKIETNQVKVNLGNANLSALMNKVKALLDPQATLKKLELRLVMAVPDEHCNIVTDEAKLTQVIINLINNALKFTPKGYIEFGVSKEEHLLKFYVKDTGIGISPEHQLLVFERFRQVETDLSRHFGGSGLGLSISKAFIEVLGGRIWLESEVGIGSTFFFTMPYFSSDAEKASAQPKLSISKDNLSGIVILVAEDEDINFLYLHELMMETGVTIIRAKNGKEAVDIGLADNRINLVLMDIKMPIMGGDEATKRIKAVRPHLPIIATTAYAMGGDKERLLEVGCDAYLSKPIGQKELLELIKNFLGR